MSMNTKRRLNWLTAFAVMAAMLFGATPQAEAVVVDTDRPKITTNGFDFGKNWDGFGAPLNGGELEWDVTSGIVSGRLTGNLYLKGVNDVCAKVQVVYFDSYLFYSLGLDTDNDGVNDAVIRIEESDQICADSNSRFTQAVDIEPAGHSEITGAHVKINKLGGSGVWETAGSTVHFMDEN